MITQITPYNYPIICGMFGEDSWYQITDSLFSDLPILIIVKLGNFEFTTLHISHAEDFLESALKLVSLTQVGRGIAGLGLDQSRKDFRSLYKEISTAYKAYTPNKES